MGRRLELGIVCGWLCAGACFAQDTMSDTWLATDALNRTLPGLGVAPAVRTNKFVGIFYYIWQGVHGYDHAENPKDDANAVKMPKPSDTNSPYTISEILRAPMEQRKWGPLHAMHHWGRPLLDYYVATDEWVIRKHAQMLSDAGVDVIFFDVTNGFDYRAVYMNIFRIYADIRAKGGRTPAVSFLTNSGHERVVRRLYDALYSKGLYKDLWFYWKGKPLLLANPEGLEPHLVQYFTLRRSWAWTKGQKWFGDGKDAWPWLDHAPQNYGWHDAPDKPEQVVVCTAEHPDSNRGKSFSNGKNPKPFRTEQGLYFAEQWKRALEVDPEFILITQWNEWVAMRFSRKQINRGSYAGEKSYDPEAVFVDVYNEEFNRDIEPMTGGYGDNYYYQMWQNIRLFKGVHPAPKASPAMGSSGANSGWSTVLPRYCDDLNDTFPRNHFGYGRIGQLTNTTGRNDLRSCQLAQSKGTLFKDGTLWFRADCEQPLTSPDAENWMVLYIGMDKRQAPAWQGFHFKVCPQWTGTSAQLFAFDNKAWIPLSLVSCTVSGNSFVVTIPRKTLGLAKDADFSCRFKWCDNILDGDPMRWWMDGDTAPNGRAAYAYKSR